MPWFKVDDKLHDHRKARAAGVAAMGLWVLAGAWSMDNLSDGFIPASICARWDRNYKTLAGRLVAAGFWEAGEFDREPGWWFHDWKDRQPSKVDIEQNRHAATERQRRAREAAASRRESQRDTADSHSEVTPLVTVPPTRPDPTRPTNTTSEPRKRGQRLPDDWTPTPEDVDWQRSQMVGDVLARRELPKFADYWRAKPGKDGIKLDWSATWRNWLRNTIEREPVAAARPSTPWAGA